ncbi:MAG: histidine--tRNA ligase [Butyrivibrio sp.]|nr:histidine--tRNA ligase [Butyrivibrio sp.]
MALIKKPMTGMKDILPKEMEIRDYLISLIKETYGSFGFTAIETPAVENIANLTGRQGGENEKLIFKILKRGARLNLEEASSEEDITDGGLRYDLTVPLVRFYSNNSASLPSPFKALQIGPVWRADRPQKGRFRQFYQCDIDILGEAGNLAEIELILATASTMGKIGFKGFRIKINERRILKAMAAYSGFAEEEYDTVFIILDKMDKIGLDGVREELLKEGYSEESVARYVKLFEGIKNAPDGLSYACGAIKDCLEPGTEENLREIIDSVNAAKGYDFEVEFEPSLVRGMSYYTGTVFEIEVPEFGAAVGGGGRYDKMVGRFTGQDTPACGFSIGFERIVTILLDNGFEVPRRADKTAFLIEKGIGSDRLCEILGEAQRLRGEGRSVLTVRMNKNKKFQKEQLENEGYADIREFYLNPINK